MSDDEKYDIISIDNKIKTKIKSDIKKFQNNKNLQGIDEKICDESFYILHTHQFIEEYKKLLENPLLKSFTKVKKNNKDEMMKNSKIKKAKSELIRNYIEYAKNYINITPSEKKGKKSKKSKCKEIDSDDVCSNCGKTKFVVDDWKFICIKCGKEKEIMSLSSSYNDIGRVNISNKFSYSRKNHFKECVNKFQGKQINKIPQKLFDTLENEFIKHHLINPTIKCRSSEEKRKKYAKVTKEHISIFLKESGYSNYYDDRAYIYSYMCGIKAPDISHLELKLFKFYDFLLECYLKIYKNNPPKMSSKNKSRQNFLNGQYVLFQLLRKLNYKCDKNDFNMLKTRDRLIEHDEICKELFADLNWTFTPVL